MNRLSDEVIEYAILQQALCFGEFKTKAGRVSPYFFNTGLFNDGASLARFAQFYATAIIASEIHFDILFGPAYKGIPLVTAIAIALAAQGRNAPFCFNRKESKDHGEGGQIVGAALSGRVLIVDDVISAGISVTESVNIIKNHSAQPCGLVIALDRQERGTGDISAVEEVKQTHNLPVISLATLEDLSSYLSRHEKLAHHLAAVTAYRKRFGTA